MVKRQRSAGPGVLVDLPIKRGEDAKEEEIDDSVGQIRHAASTKMDV